MNLDTILTALGIVSVPSGAGVKAFLSLRDRVSKVENRQESNHDIIAVKLDAISDKIDLRCDALEDRVARIERRVLNGEYKADH